MRVISYLAAAAAVAMATTSAYAESGKATWYGKGRRVACGGAFHPGAMTAAHKTLPCGTKVLVTNHHNGKTVVVTITDRGPYGRGMVIDLTRGAAAKIGMIRSGVAPVTVTRIN